MWLACGDVDPTVWVPPGCGDGVLDADEACDDGPANSDIRPDACRTHCQLPTCGDGATDAGEGCDDGGHVGADGCDPDCLTETGALEVEPNDDSGSANAPSTVWHATLPEGDVDCVHVDVPACGAVHVVESGRCEPGLALTLLNPLGMVRASGGIGPDGCVVIDPADEPGARWIDAGLWSVCATSVTGAEVAGTTLTFSTPDPVAEDLPVNGGDIDADGTSDVCDADRDGDGLDNDADNCPDTSNGPNTPPSTLTSSGTIRSWLTLGPFTDVVSPDVCLPSAVPYAGEPGPWDYAVGDVSSGVPWSLAILAGDTLDFLPAYGWVGAPREAYALVTLTSPRDVEATLSYGVDDGSRIWFDGEELGTVSSCQGVNADQFQQPLSIAEGDHTLVMKVHDAGGGWGLTARLLDEAGAPIVDIVLTPGPAGWVADQTDGDSDGLGDVCDPTP